MNIINSFYSIDNFFTIQSNEMIGFQILIQHNSENYTLRGYLTENCTIIIIVIIIIMIFVPGTKSKNKSDFNFILNNNTKIFLIRVFVDSKRKFYEIKSFDRKIYLLRNKKMQFLKKFYFVQFLFECIFVSQKTRSKYEMMQRNPP